MGAEAPGGIRRPNETELQIHLESYRHIVCTSRHLWSVLANALAALATAGAPPSFVIPRAATQPLRASTASCSLFPYWELVSYS
jgi:hypothetical protein